MLTALVLCGVNMLLFFCRAEWRHPVNGGGRTAFCGGRRQRWWLDQSTEELGGGGICPHILHQSFPGQQCQRCHDLHMTFKSPPHMIDILSSHNLPMTFTSPIDDLYMTHRWPYYLHITWVWCRLICKYEFQMSLHEQMSDLQTNFLISSSPLNDHWSLDVVCVFMCFTCLCALCVLPVCVSPHAPPLCGGWTYNDLYVRGTSSSDLFQWPDWRCDTHYRMLKIISLKVNCGQNAVHIHSGPEKVALYLFNPDTFRASCIPTFISHQQGVSPESLSLNLQ